MIVSITYCLLIYIYIYTYEYIYIPHHQHLFPLLILSLSLCLSLSLSLSLFLSLHPSLSSITPGRSFKLHPVSVQSRCRQVLICKPALARPCVGVHFRTSLRGSSKLPQHCPAYLIRLIWVVLVMEGKWWVQLFRECSFQDLFHISCSILAQCPSSFFSLPFVSVHMVHP